MRVIVLSSWPLFLGMALLMLGNGLQGTLLGLRADLEGFATAVTGLVMSAFYVGMLAGSVITPRLVGAVGHVRVFAAFAAIASAAILLHAVFIHPLVWTAMRALAGFSFAALYIVAESWLNSQAGNQDRAKLLSFYMVVSFAAAGSGQLLLNVADPSDFVLFALVSVLLSVAVVPMLLSSGPVPPLPTTRSPALSELYRSSPLGIAGTFASGAASGAVLGMGAVFAAQSGLAPAAIAQFMFVVLIAGMIGQFPIGYLADRFDRRVVLIVTATVGGLLSLAGAVVGGGLGLALLAAASAFLFPLYSISVAHTNDHLDNDIMVAAAAGLMFANGIGSVLGPFAAGLAMAVLGPPGFALYLTAVLGTVAVFGVYRTFRRASVPLDAQGPTVPIPRATPIGTALAQSVAIEQMAEDDQKTT